MSDGLELKQEAEEVDAHYQRYSRGETVSSLDAFFPNSILKLYSCCDNSRIPGSEHPPLRLLASILARLTRSAASKLGRHEGAISVGSIEYEIRGRVVYISGTSGHMAIASIHVISRPCFHVITSQNIPGSPIPFASLSRESLGTRLHYRRLFLT